MNLRSVPHVLDPGVVSREQDVGGTGGRIDGHPRSGARLGVGHTGSTGQIHRSDRGVGGREQRHALVVSQDTDEMLTGEGVDCSDWRCTRFHVRNRRQGGEVATGPGAEVVVDLVQPLVVAEDVDVELLGDGIHQAGGRTRRVGHRSLSRHVEGPVADTISTAHQVDSTVAARVEHVVVPDQGVHERVGVGSVEDANAGRQGTTRVATSGSVEADVPGVTVVAGEHHMDVPRRRIDIAHGVRLAGGVWHPDVGGQIDYVDVVIRSDTEHPDVTRFCREHDIPHSTGFACEAKWLRAGCDVGYPDVGGEVDDRPSSVGLGDLVDVAVISAEDRVHLPGEGVVVGLDVGVGVDVRDRNDGADVLGGVGTTGQTGDVVIHGTVTVVVDPVQPLGMVGIGVEGSVVAVTVGDGRAIEVEVGFVRVLVIHSSFFRTDTGRCECIVGVLTRLGDLDHAVAVVQRTATTEGLVVVRVVRIVRHANGRVAKPLGSALGFVLHGDGVGSGRSSITVVCPAATVELAWCVTRIVQHLGFGCARTVGDATALEILHPLVALAIHVGDGVATVDGIVGVVADWTVGVLDPTLPLLSLNDIGTSSASPIVVDDGTITDAIGVQIALVVRHCILCSVVVPGVQGRVETDVAGVGRLIWSARTGVPPPVQTIFGSRQTDGRALLHAGRNGPPIVQVVRREVGRRSGGDEVFEGGGGAAAGFTRVVIGSI